MAEIRSHVTCSAKFRCPKCLQEGRFPIYYGEIPHFLPAVYVHAQRLKSERISHVYPLPLLSRRAILRASFGLGVIVPAAGLLAACGASATATSSSSAISAAPAPTTTASVVATTATVSSASATRAVVATTASSAVPATTTPGQAAAPGKKTALSIATYAGATDDWQRHAAQAWQDAHPDVNLTVDSIAYADMPSKQLTLLASGTLEDVSFSGIKWFAYSASKGAFRAIDDYVKQQDPGMSDFFQTAITSSSMGGKLYALPYLLHPGNPALFAYNKDLLQRRGVKEPTDDWTVDDFVALGKATTDVGQKVFGTNYFPSTYYDFCSLARTWGGDVLSADGKQFTFNTDKGSQDAAQWAVNLRTIEHIAPSSAEAKDLTFVGGQYATAESGSYNVLVLEKQVGSKFGVGWALFPKGPTGLRGYQGFVENFSIFAGSKQPELAYSLVQAETSKETGIWAVVNTQYQPSARKSVWAAPEVTKLTPVFGRVLNWMSTVNGPFPMPYNLRYTDLEGAWEKTSPPLFYGTVSYGTGLQQVQDACQAFVQMPRT
jgi:ABC-type glycerol-3-phosphate transport system substrate-binding protein